MSSASESFAGMAFMRLQPGDWLVTAWARGLAVEVPGRVQLSSE